MLVLHLDDRNRTMDGTLAWYMARAGGLLAWVLLSASVLWGLFLSTKALGKAPRPAWLLDLHRFLGAAAVVFTGIHVATLIADSYTDLSWLQVLVPFTSSWRPVAVAWGVIAMDLLLAVELTSLLRKHLPRTWWRRIHLSSFALFVVSTVHAVTAGSSSWWCWPSPWSRSSASPSSPGCACRRPPRARRSPPRSRTSTSGALR